jgi:two-component system, chemotaxis family, chemotaxis protein CheY
MVKRILIVDDSESIREVIRCTLLNAGFDVLLGKHGLDALKYFDGRTIDLLITDLHMPFMDGIELIKEVRKLKEYKKLPILFLTTDSQNEKKIEAKAAGASGWLIKPFISSKLLETITKVIQ